ncbi:DUF4129 domain-containing protein [Pseudomonas gingeri]|uniref:DUF4129 domain-containing protein n=1 Tax=Pseudomonas gingeri TaxID=117681 RepID=UPI0015A3D7F0|nr:DUF4129 domain-containing protein [Pseudomonas gingeri]NWD68042.1 DUF4129 domain-containing protein [Pseudomonas gingeri]NWD73100.1 DUF4129 domain-containing protein [Pseudomonas gingeri]
MRLTDASVAIRPRSTWEAMDLGVLLVQQHRGVLMGSWALVTLPIFALLSLLLWEHPSIALLLFWWLKPAFERLPLYILSTALFGDTPTLKQALSAWPRLLKPQLLASLTWRRLSLSRSFTLPVQQLEGLDGHARQQRLRVLLPQSLSGARWLTLIGTHLEYVLWIGLMAVFYLLLPRQIDIDWHWQKLLFAAQHEWLWLEHLSNAFYALILILWEPVYVACGFSLYLNRRTVLEAWDIELIFRQLRQRLLPVIAALLLGVGLLSVPFAPPVMAAEPPAPNTPRLLKQPLTSQASQDAIKAQLQAPPFKNPETVTRWRLGEASAKASDKISSSWLKTLLERFDSRIAGRLAQGLEILLWAALFGLLAWLTWRYRNGLQTFVGRRPKPRGKPAPSATPQLFGLALDLDSLPDDIAASAEALWPQQPREAMSLLYRGLLSRLLHDYQLPLKSADTEGQVLERLAQLPKPDLQAFSQELTRHWQNLAYGHRLPTPPQQQALCASWRQLFGPGVTQ